MKKNTLLHIGVGVIAAVVTLKASKVIRKAAEHKAMEAEFDEIVEDTRN